MASDDILQNLKMQLQVQLEKDGRTEPLPGWSLEAWAILVAGVEIVRTTRVLGTAILAEVNTLRRVTCGEVAKAMESEGKRIILPKH